MLDSQLLSGVLSIDQEHQSIFRTLHELIGSPVADQTAEKFQAAVAQLGMQLRRHFENEEGILRTCGMPSDDVDKHLRSHSDILDEYAQVEARLMSDRSVEHAALIGLINGWLHTHDIEFDSKIKAYLVDVERP